jgi:hypothetical protein
MLRRYIFIMLPAALVGLAAGLTPAGNVDVRAQPGNINSVDCLDCNPCLSNTGHYHDPHVDWGVSASDHSCTNGGPCSAHDIPCGPTNFGSREQNVIRVAASSNDVRTVRRLATLYPQTVVIDERRNGVHLLGCNQIVYAFFPFGHSGD